MAQKRHAIPAMISVMVALAAASGAGLAKLAPTKNLTVYRITPQNVTGVVNMNTGDAAGDTYFALYEMIFPLYCRQMPGDGSCDGSSQKTLNNYNFDVYEKSVVEVDTRWGVYSGCLPNTKTGKFECEPYIHNKSACWWEQSGPDGRNFSDLNGVCHKSECRCDAVTKRAVGMYNKPMGQHPVTWHNQTAMWKQIEDMSGNLNGNWYVTPEGGQCTANQILGSGDCFWKFQGVQRTINATCLNNRLRDNVLAANPACWKVLPQPSNRSADGWSECLLATITGKAIGSAPAPAKAMTRDAILAPFLDAFLPEGAGGCPGRHTMA